MMIRHGFMLLAAMAVLGCLRPKSHESPPTTKQQTSLKRMITSNNAPNDLKQLALFYQQYNLTFNRSPASLAEFKAYIQRDARKLASQLDGGVYVVLWKVNDLSSNNMIVYENNLDEQGRRLVAMGDGSVQKLYNKDFQSLLTAAKTQQR